MSASTEATRSLPLALAVLCLGDTATAQSTATVTQMGSGSEAFVERRAQSND